MTIKDFFKRFVIGSTWTLKCSCIGKSDFFMKEGESYEIKTKVYNIKRIRRQWEEPGKEIVFESELKNGNKGYNDLSTNNLNNATIEDKGEFIRLVFKDDKNVMHDYYPVKID